jgi:hypothetical protein
LTTEQARSVIYMSEDRFDHEGRNPGHTLRNHVNISREGLTRRMEAGPGENDDKAVFWRSAFLSVQSAAELLAEAVAALGGNRAVANFGNSPQGMFISELVTINAFWCRDMRGRAWAPQVKLNARKVNDRPHGLHLITFYPAIML